MVPKLFFYELYSSRGRGRARVDRKLGIGNIKFGIYKVLSLSNITIGLLPKIEIEV